MLRRNEFLKSLMLGMGAIALPQGVAAQTDLESTSEAEAERIGADEYLFKMRLNVPQVVDNTTSQGKRIYRVQTIKGPMYIVWLADGNFRIEFGNLVNLNFKVGGENVTYEGREMKEVVYSRFNYIGDNRTGKFIKPCLAFFGEFEPSYAKGEASEDNSFYLMFSGYGMSTVKRAYGGARIATCINGYVAGVQGCGCSAYGHMSPTRDATIMGPGEKVNDVVSTNGRWRMVWKGRVA